MDLITAFANFWFPGVVVALLAVYVAYDRKRRAADWDFIMKLVNEREDTKSALSEIPNKLEAIYSSINSLIEISETHEERASTSYRALSQILHNNKRSVCNNRLDDEQAYMTVRDMVKAASDDKLDYISGVLKANHIKGNEKTTADKIRQYLTSRSSVYINDLNRKYVFPIPSMGNWVEQNFEFDLFFEEVMIVVLAESEMTKEQAILKKVSEIRTIMARYQNRMLWKLKTHLEENALNYPN